MAGGMARITLSAAGVAATTAVMHQLGYHHRLGECLAAMLTDAGFQLLSVVRVIVDFDRLSVCRHHGVSPTFWAGLELGILAAMLLHHNHMAVAATVWRELQGPYPFFCQMILRQPKACVLHHRATTFGTSAFFAMAQLFLVNTVVNPTYPWCHPGGQPGTLILVGRLIDRPRIDGLLGQRFGRLQDTVVMAETDPCEIQ